MMELAGREHDYSRYDSLATQLARRRGLPHPYAARALTAIGSGSAERRATVLAEVRGADVTDPVPVWAVAMLSGDLAAARSIVESSLRRAPTPREASQLLYAQAGVELAAGRWRAGRAALSAASAAGVRAAAPVLKRVPLQVQAMVTALAALPVPPGDVDADRAAVAGWPTVIDSTASAEDMPARMQPQMRAYLLGLLDARRGAYDEALEHATNIERLTTPAGAEPVARTLARGVRASVALQRGDPTAALAILGPTNDVVPPIYAAEFRMAEVHARWLRAEALFVLRRDDEALHWYALANESPVVTGAMLELVLATPSHLRRGEIHERRGNAAGARSEYQRFQAMWREADGSARALVASAADRAARLAPN